MPHRHRIALRNPVLRFQEVRERSPEYRDHLTPSYMTRTGLPCGRILSVQCRRTGRVVLAERAGPRPRSLERKSEARGRLQSDFPRVFAVARNAFGNGRQTDGRWAGSKGKKKQQRGQEARKWGGEDDEKLARWCGGQDRLNGVRAGAGDGAALRGIHGPANGVVSSPARPPTRPKRRAPDRE